jgi:CheY-like chemotaxis protein
MTEPERLPEPAEPTVLVVEDEVLIRLMISGELRDVGLRVVEAENADEALAYVRTDDRVQIVFTDVRMPGSMDGLELAKRLQADFPLIKVFLTSGHLRPHEVFDGMLIPKPYKLTEVVSQIVKALGEPEPGGSEPRG